MARGAYKREAAKSRADTVRLSHGLHGLASGRGLINHCMPNRQGIFQGSKVIELACNCGDGSDWLGLQISGHGEPIKYSNI
jgi:hypothetical protein